MSDSEFHLLRSAVDPIIGRSSELMRGTRFMPVQQGGRVVGFELRTVRADGLLAKLGLLERDRIEAINGLPLSSPRASLQAYARLRTTPSFDVRILRGGRPMTINYRIR